MDKIYFLFLLVIGVFMADPLYAQTPVLSYPTPHIFALGKPITPIPIKNTGAHVTSGSFAQSSVVAGSRLYGNKDTSDGGSASFANPIGIAVDPAGNTFIADANNNAIRKIDPNGGVTTFAGGGAAGNADGIGTAARFNYPTGLAGDIYGNIYVADYANNAIRKITPSAVVTTITNTGLNLPYGLAVDANNNIIVADTYNNLIKKVSQYGGVTIIAGNGGTSLTDGNGTAASFYLPYGVVLDRFGNIYVTDRNNNAIRKITPTGDVTTITHNTNIYKPTSITIDSIGTLYVANGRGFISKVTTTGVSTVFAGADSLHDDGVSFGDGVDTAARFGPNDGISFDPGGNLVIADGQNFVVRRVSLIGYQLSPRLPPGLSMNSQATISGTPDSVSSAKNYVVTGYTTAASSAAVINISVLNIVPQTITFNPIPNAVYGDADLTDTATSTNTTIPIIYTSNNGAVATIVDNKVHIIGAGNTNITANQAAGPSYTAAAPVTRPLTVAKAALTITPNDQNKITGQDNPVLTFKYSGFLNGDDSTNLTTKPTAQTTAVIGFAAGNYPITVSGGVSNNYSFTYGSANLNISAKPAIANSGPTAFLAGDSVILSVNYPAGYIYQWNYNGTAIPGETKSDYTATITGDYTVGVTINGKTVVSPVTSVTAAFTLPAQNFSLKINAVTCKGSDNGIAFISAAKSLDYVANIVDTANVSKSYPFTDTLTIGSLAPGAYSICISVTGQTYSQCYNIVITEPKDLTVYSTINRTQNKVNLQLDGAGLYNIDLNGTLYTTSKSELTLPLIAGNNKILITTDRLCQGMVEKSIIINDFIPYPNPFTGILNVNIGNTLSKQVQVNVYSVVTGKQVYTNNYTNQTGIVQMDLKNLELGVYYLNLNMGNTTSSFKILKK
jgi:sugar lactone lactonase YvrE